MSLDDKTSNLGYENNTFDSILEEELQLSYPNENIIWVEDGECMVPSNGQTVVVQTDEDSVENYVVEIDCNESVDSNQPVDEIGEHVFMFSNDPIVYEIDETNYHYAVIRDGKLHLNESIENPSTSDLNNFEDFEESIDYLHETQSPTKGRKKLFAKILQIKKKAPIEEVPDHRPMLIKKHFMSKRSFEHNVSKILVGLMDMESLEKKLVNTNLTIKLVEKVFNAPLSEYRKKVSYICGRMELDPEENWGFVQNDSFDKRKDATNLTLYIVVDKNGCKSTKVSLNCSDVSKICKKCGRGFRNSVFLHRHLLKAHKQRKAVTLQCNSGQFADESDLNEQAPVHAGSQYACETCGKGFASQGDLSFHSRIHDSGKQFYCGVCGREFSRQSNLLRHEEIHKGSDAAFRCEICGCSYNYNSSLTRHMVQNHIAKGEPSGN